MMVVSVELTSDTRAIVAVATVSVSASVRLVEAVATVVPALRLERRVVESMIIGMVESGSPSQVLTLTLRARVELVIEEMALRTEMPSLGK